MSTIQDQSIIVSGEEAAGVAAVMIKLPAAEVANTITHGIGLALSIVGGFALTATAWASGDVWRVAGCGIFAMTLVAVYAASTLSHGCTNPRVRRLFQILDQGFIYLLIVGTFTPFSLAYLRTGWWWLFLGLMWTLALCGCVSKLMFEQRVGLALWSYVLLGWLPIIPTVWLIDLVPTVALVWMLIGGLCYTVGTVFLVWDIERLHFHAIWHILVIAGSTCHFFAIFYFVAH